MCFIFGRNPNEMTKFVKTPYCHEKSTRNSNSLHDSSATIPKCYNDVRINSFCSCTTAPWNSIPAEYFPLSRDLSCFNYGVDIDIFHIWALFISFSAHLPSLHFYFCSNYMPCLHAQCDLLFKSLFTDRFLIFLG